MKRTRKPFDLKPLIYAVLIACSVLSISVALLTTYENKTLREQNKALSERVAKKPEAFGGVGYITEVNHEELYIDAVGYGRFLITADESQFLQVGDKLPTYIMLRGHING